MDDHTITAWITFCLAAGVSLGSVAGSTVLSGIIKMTGYGPSYDDSSWLRTAVCLRNNGIS